jgi:dienelactone hydrolase
MFKHSHFWLVAVCVCIAVSGNAFARTWTSKAGTKIDAELQGRDLQNVNPLKSDGTVQKVPISALSEADQYFIKTGKEQPPSAAKPVVPASAPAVPASPVGATNSAAGASTNAALVEGVLRTWATVDGHTAEARLVRQGSGQVILQNKDGQFFTVPVKNLAAKDRMFLISEQYKEFEKQPEPAKDYEFPGGKISGPIKCKKDEKWTYYVYLPKNFSLSRKWPVIFVMSPNGGNNKTADRYTAGAELTDWIVAVSVESKNNFKESGSAVLTMVDDVLERFPVDKKRLYSSGFSGGARMAFSLAAAKKFAGVLPCGAGGLDDKLDADSRVYGLVGSNCFNRWDMACTFKKYAEGKSVLWFFPGKHAWADAALVADGMSWLNYKYLESNAKRDKGLEAEWHRFIKKNIERMQPMVESDPETAYKVARSIDKNKVQVYYKQEIEEVQKALDVSDVVKQFKLADAEMRKLVGKYFETDLMDYKNNNCPDALVKDAKALADKYPGLKLSETIRQMGGPAPL